MNASIRCFLALLTITACTAAPAAGAAASYPDRPIRVVVPYPPGAAGDIALRQIQPALEKELGQTLVVDYRTGAGGNIGTGSVARAEPDGYTLVLGATNNFVINQFLYENLGFDPLADLEPVGKLADVPAFVYVSASVPAKDMQSLAGYVRDHPRMLNYGSPGTGTAPHLSAFMLNQRLGGNMTHIPYRGAAPGVVALLADEIHLYIGGYSLAAAHLAEGKVRALAVAADERFPALPDVPTLDELGMSGVVLSNWWGLAAPRGTPPEVIDRLSAALDGVLSQPGTQTQLDKLGFVARPSTPAGFKRELTEEAERWEAIVRASGVKLEE